MNVDSLYQSALALPEHERAQLAERLLGSLAPIGPSRLHPAWQEEIRRRLAEIDSGKETPIPWDEVQRSAWEAVDQAGASSNG